MLLYNSYGQLEGLSKVKLTGIPDEINEYAKANGLSVRLSPNRIYLYESNTRKEFDIDINGEIEKEYNVKTTEGIALLYNYDKKFNAVEYYREDAPEGSSPSTTCIINTDTLLNDDKWTKHIEDIKGIAGITKDMDTFAFNKNSYIISNNLSKNINLWELYNKLKKEPEITNLRYNKNLIHLRINEKPCVIMVTSKGAMNLNGFPIGNKNQPIKMGNIKFAADYYNYDAYGDDIKFINYCMKNEPLKEDSSISFEQEMNEKTAR